MTRGAEETPAQGPGPGQPILPREVKNPFFLAWSHWVLRLRWPLLLLTLATTAFFTDQVFTHLRIDNSVEAFASSKDRTNDTLDELRDEFGRDDVFLVLVAGDVFSMPYLRRLAALHHELEHIDVEVHSLGQRSKRVRDKRARRRAAQEAPQGAAQAEPGGAGLAAGASAVAGEPPGVEVGVGGQDGDFGGEDFGGEDFGGEDFGGGPGSAAGDGGGEFGADAWAGEKGGSVVDEIISLINIRETTFEDGGLKVGDLMDPLPAEAELPALKARVLADKAKVGQVVGPGARHSVIVLRTQFMSEEDSDLVYRELLKIARRHEAEGFSVKVAGPPALGAAINSLMIEDLRVTAFVAFSAMFLMLLYLFRHPWGVIGPVGVVVQASLWTFGAMAMLDVPMTMLSNILPAFLICVGVGDSVHIQSVYRDKRRTGMTNEEAIHYALSTVGVPVLFTTLTTMVGLLSFRTASLDAIADVGTLGAFGVLVALVHSLVFLPIVLSFNDKSLIGARAEGGGDHLDRFLAAMTAFSRDPGATPGTGLDLKGAPRRVRALALALLLALGSIGCATMLRLYHNPLSWIPQRFEVKQAFDETDRYVGGTANVQLLVDTGRPGGVKSVALLRQLGELEAWIKAYDQPGIDVDLVGNAISILDVVKESNRSFHGGDEAFYKLPESDKALAELLFMFESAGPDQLRRLVTTDMRKTQMTFRVRWVDSSSYGPFTEYIEQGIDRFIPPGISVRPTGSAYSLFAIIANLISDLMRSFGFAFGAITVMMVVMLRSLKLGAIAMVPNLLPILMVMGGMGLFDVPIDLVNLLIASIAIGIAVDDTIHYLHHFKAHHDLNGRVEEAIEHAVHHSGRAITATSVILCIGFLVYTTADMYNLQRFGALVAATVMLALLINILFAPALLRMACRDKAPASAAASFEGDPPDGGTS